MAEEEKEILYSNNNGEFQIENLPEIYNGDLQDIENIKVVFSKEGFQSTSVPLYTKFGSLRNIGLVELLDNEIYLQKEIDKNQGLTKEQVNGLLKDKKDLNWYYIKALNEIINQLKKRVLPLILEPIIVKFGISDPIGLIKQIKEIKEKGQSFIEENQNLSDEEKERRRQQLRETAQTGATVAGAAALDMGKDRIQQEIINLISENTSNLDFCPDPNTLKEIVRIKNSITLQLNRTMNTLDTTTKFVTGLNTFIQTTNIVYQALRISPIPIPPGAPVSLVGAIEDTKEFLNKNIEKFSSITAGTLAILVIVRETLNQILEYSSLLDDLIQQCYPETELDSLNTELRNLTQEQNNTLGIGDNILTETNGFILEIESEITNNPLKRKRAIAKDSKGVIALKGQYSFSSKEQILLDELSFYIKSNNLKAE